MANRASEQGWVCASMHDPQGRRGVWYRELPGGAVEVCAGREGDDYYVKVEAGRSVTVQDVASIIDCLSVGSWMLGESRGG